MSLNEIGVAYDSRDGTLQIQNPGWHCTHFLVKTSSITLLPIRLEMLGSTSKVLNVKLVRFKPDHVREFIELQGFEYMLDRQSTFMGYAFSNKAYPFLEIIQ